MDKGLLLLSFTIISVGVFLFCFERKRISSKKLVLIAVLGALAALGRVPFAAIPSAQPTTFMVIITGYVFGGGVGFIVGAIAAVVSNMFLGQGPWTIIQMLAWGLCGLSAGLLAKVFPSIPRWGLIVFGFVWGFVFGWITNLWHWLAFIYPLTFKTWLLTNVVSFWFDLTHGLTNALFLALLGKDFINVLKRFKQKLTYSHQTTIIKEGEKSWTH